MKKSDSREADHHIVEFDDDGAIVDAGLVGDLLNLPADQIQHHIRQGTITTLCEAGVDEHEGGFRLSFFHGSRRAQIEINSQGQICNRTVIDFGDRPLPASLRGVQATQTPRAKANR